MKRLKGILSIILLTSILLVTGCSNKKSISADEFKQKLEEKQYTIIDRTDNFNDGTKVYSATNPNNSHQIVFYEFSNNDTAINFYDQNKSSFEESKGSGYNDSSISLANYSKYTLETSNEYKVISRIDNTLIIFNVNKSEKAAVKKVIEELGY